MRTNKVKARLAAGETSLGFVIASYAPDILELMGALGFHYVVLDAEHELFEDTALLDLIRAAEAFDITPIVRIPNDPDAILRCLDGGATGIHVPRVNTSGEAQAVVNACKFHPQGTRTFYALGRSANFGIGTDDKSFAEKANKEMLVICQIEEVLGVNNLAEILAVPHMDTIQVGPKDLWQSMGMPPQKEVQAAVERVIKRSVAAGKHVSMQVRLTPALDEQITRYAQLGVRMLTFSPRDIIVEGATSLLQTIRARLT